jgi:hypothetical protein
MRPLVSPLPAIAAGKGPFHVTGVPADSGASCAPPSGGRPGLFNVPLESGSIQALAIRMHELGHLGLVRAGVVPEDVVRRLNRARIHHGWIQFALDIVVNAFMLSRGNREIAHLKLWAGALPSEIPRWLAAMEFLRSQGLGREMHIRMSLQARAQFSPDELNVLCSTARILQKRGAEAAFLGTEEFRKLLRKLQKTFGPETRDTSHPLLESPIIITDRLARGERAASESQWNGWGPMALSEPPLPHCSRGGRCKTAKKIMASYCGAFRFPHRALLPAADGRAFGLKRRIHGGAILIDCSGSMNLTTDELRSVVSRSPAATVALYAGLPGDQSGLLLIVGKNGRFAEIEEITSCLGKGNIIDGPALRWLSRQPEPRIWVSDGCVTGRGDRSGINLDKETDSIVRIARIKRIASVEKC